IAGFAGAALWLPPGIEPDKQQILDVLRSSVGPDRLPTLMAVFDEMGSSRPEEPHWYLPVIGVDPAYQGRGHGHALLHHGLERVDDEGKIAYLENTNPDYTRLYESHGFRVVGTIEVAEAPPLIQMLRPAQ
ncbi:MAG TPA: GNAT family N-acetyltransferase, partial [Noviherbaspirillum sp.]|nr:GNAT family N-acetyltransferase [Noviherbaspirillum sp.]